MTPQKPDPDPKLPEPDPDPGEEEPDSMPNPSAPGPDVLDPGGPLPIPVP
jgi:hypothetical protein